MTHSTAREGAASITDKRGRKIFEDTQKLIAAKDVEGLAAQLFRLATGAAVFNGKALVFASTCELHPKYQALRPPRSKKPGCTCAEIYSRRNEIVERR